MPTRFSGTPAPNGEPPDEHVFYDLNVAKSVAAAIADRLAAIDPANAADYRANAAEFGRGADAIADLRTRHRHHLPRHRRHRDRTRRALPAGGVGPGESHPARL